MTEPAPTPDTTDTINVKKTPSKWPMFIGIGFLSLLLLVVAFFIVKHVVSNSATTQDEPAVQSTQDIDPAMIESMKQKLAAQQAQLAQVKAQTSQLGQNVNINGHTTININAASSANSDEPTQEVADHRNDPMLVFSNTTTSSTNTQSGNNDTLSNGSSIIKSVDAEQILHPSYVITAGTEIHGVMETAIDSELQGVVTATVSEDVWSEDGKRILIPRGSKVVGEYSGSHSQAATRIYIIWQRVTTPPPASIAIDVDSEGADALGQSGQEADSIDTHFFARFGMASLLSIIGAGVSTAGVTPNTNFNSANAVQQGVGQGFQQSATQSLQSSGNIPDTLHVYQGQRINIMVHQDLNFYAILNHG